MTDATSRRLQVSVALRMPANGHCQDRLPTVFGQDVPVGDITDLVPAVVGHESP